MISRIRQLLILTAAVELMTGVALQAAPSLVGRLLLGVPFDAPSALIVARLAGAAIIAIGLACWLARADGATRAGRALLSAISLYNLAAVALLSYAGIGLHLHGPLLWAAVILHLGLSIWCLACLRFARMGALS
jgi:hypothetical protein